MSSSPVFNIDDVQKEFTELSNEFKQLEVKLLLFLRDFWVKLFFVCNFFTEHKSGIFGTLGRSWGLTNQMYKEHQSPAISLEWNKQKFETVSFESQSPLLRFFSLYLIPSFVRGVLWRCAIGEGCSQCTFFIKNKIFISIFLLDYKNFIEIFRI